MSDRRLHQVNRQANQLRIIGGRWRGRRIGFASVPGLRPTPDRVRETLFNWLGQDLAGATTLDLFAGAGGLTLGFELARREYLPVFAVEIEPAAARTYKSNFGCQV